MSNNQADFTLLNNKTLRLLLGLANARLVIAQCSDEVAELTGAIADIKTVLLVRATDSI